MKIYVQLIQNHLRQDIPTIILTIQKQKYVFNIPSCFQRFIKDHRQKFPKASNLFFTKTTTDTLAGLNGLMLTIFESRFCQDTKLFVSNELWNYLEQVRYKMGFKILPYSYLNLFTHQARTGIREISQVYELINRPDYAKIFTNSEKFIETSLKEEEKNDARRFFSEEGEFNDGEIRIIPLGIEAKGEKLINYICIPKKLEGKVLINKVKELNVPPRLISKLIAEGTLTLEDGSEVRAEQIKEPDSLAPALLIFHYNSTDAIKAILHHPKFIAYASSPLNCTDTIVHIVERTETSIIESIQFTELIKMFPLSIKHLIYHQDYHNKADEPLNQPVPKHMELVSFVHKYFPTCMPDILANSRIHIESATKSNKILQLLFPEHIMLAYKRCYELVLVPKKSQGYFPMVDGKEKDKENMFIVPEIEAKDAQELQQINISTPSEFNHFKDINPEVVFLGTGSMKPSKYRNVSSIYIEMTPHHSILLDCGEGSYYQLFNHYGYEKIDEVVFKIRTVFITHIHSDHNLGILDLIAQRNKILRKMFASQQEHSTRDYSGKSYQQKISKHKLFLVIPYNVLPWFDSYVSNIEDLLEGCEVLFVQTITGESFDLSNATASKDEKLQCKINRSQSEMKDQSEENSEELCEQPNEQLQAYYSPLMKQLYQKYGQFQSEIYARFAQALNEIGVVNFQPVHVDHCPQSFAIVIEHKSKVKISYSGDCRPSLDFAKAAHRSTLLIHEATFGDDLQKNAIENMHTTVGEAIDIAMSSQSWKLALTHFSQRYVSAKEIVNPSIYKLNPNKLDYARHHSIVCFDHLRMRMDELPVMAYESRKICEIFPSDSQQ